MVEQRTGTAQDLNEVLVFVRVVQAGSFTAAARSLGMPKSTVSRKVSELERRLAARLLQRTTRTLSLTDAGRLYFEHAERAVVELEAAGATMARMQDAPRGLLRVTTPLNFGYLGPIVCAFARRFPEVQVEMVATDRVVDLVDEGYDVAIRAGRLADSALVARHLGVLRRVVVASPEYLKEHAAPSTPQELAAHEAVVFSGGRERNRWTLVSGGDTAEVVVRPRLSFNDFDLVAEAAVLGLGVAMVPVDRCAPDLRAKRLRRVLPAWTSPELPVQAVYPSARHLSPKVRAFLDHVKDSMSPPPWEQGA